MLQTIRSTVGSWVVKILFVLLIASFGIWGVGDMFRKAGQSNAAITVGRTEITYKEVDQDFRKQMDRLRPVFGGSLTADQARKFGLLDQTIATLVQRILFDHAASDAGIEVGDKLVRARIATLPAFRNAQGAFDPYVFQSVLRNNGMSEGEFVALMHDNIAREMTAGIVSNGAGASTTETQALYRFRGEKRVAEVATIPHAAMGDVGTPDDAAIRAYYDDHSVTFTAPEYRTLTVARLSADALGKTADITDDDLRQIYEERLDQFQTPETRSFHMALVDSEAKATALSAAAKKSGLDDAAKAEGIEVVNMDKVADGELPQLGDVVFSMNAGQISDPVKTDLGWYVVELTDVQEQSVKPFEAVRDSLLEQARHDKGLDLMYEVGNKVEDGLAAGRSLEDVAKENGLTLTTYTDIDATGKTAAGETLKEPTDLPTVLKTAFTQTPQETGTLTQNGDTESFLVRVDSITQPALRPIDSVRDQIVAGWQADEREKLAKKKAEEIAAAIKDKGNDADLKALAGAAGGSVTETEPFVRSAQTVKGLPATLIGQIFTLKPGQAITGNDGDAEVVARLSKVVAAAPTAADADLKSVKDSVLQGIAADLTQQFAMALQERYPVSIQRDKIDQMYASSGE